MIKSEVTASVHLVLVMKYMIESLFITFMSAFARGMMNTATCLSWRHIYNPGNKEAVSQVTRLNQITITQLL